MTGRGKTITLVAMTLASSMILIDQTAVPLATSHAVSELGGSLDEGQWILTANILPLAALMIVGGQLGDRYGLRKIFLLGAVLFACATATAASSVNMTMMITARVVQGVGAALMMPTAVAIVEVVYPVEKRGSALGVLAGGSAFFAALGPVLGGLLTGIDWRLVFWINVPLAIITIALTLAFTPPLTPTAAKGGIDRWGIVTFAIGLVGLVYGLGEVSATSLTDPQVLIPVAIGVLALVIFVFVERAQTDPMIDFRLLRKRNLLAANISQFLAGSIELGLGFLLPYFYLLAVGISPQAAGLALLPATVPIILAGPLAGKAYDKVGPRLPLVLGFLVLAASGVALAAATSALSPWAMIPGLLLQGAGLGIVLTVNDPTGLGAVSESDSGQAAGMLNTSEQFGGAVGIAVLGALELDYYRGQLYDKLADRGLFPNAQQAEQFRDFILDAEQYGVRHTPKDASVVQVALADSIASRIPAFELTFLVTSGISLLGAVVVLALIKSGRPHHPVGVFSRRSRWVLDKNDRTDALPAAQRPGS